MSPHSCRFVCISICISDDKRFDLLHPGARPPCRSRDEDRKSKSAELSPRLFFLTLTRVHGGNVSCDHSGMIFRTVFFSQQTKMQKFLSHRRGSYAGSLREIVSSKMFPYFWRAVSILWCFSQEKYKQDLAKFIAQLVFPSAEAKREHLPNPP